MEKTKGRRKTLLIYVQILYVHFLQINIQSTQSIKYIVQEILFYTLFSKKFVPVTGQMFLSIKMVKI